MKSAVLQRLSFETPSPPSAGPAPTTPSGPRTYRPLIYFPKGNKPDCNMASNQAMFTCCVCQATVARLPALLQSGFMPFGK